jgi:diaminopimelate decarboxylase
MHVNDRSRSIVRGKSFDVGVEPGRSIWDNSHTLLAGLNVLREKSREYALSDQARFSSPQTILPRLGQGDRGADEDLGQGNR